MEEYKVSIRNKRTNALIGIGTLVITDSGCYLKDMALTRMEAMNRITSLGYQWSVHMEKYAKSRNEQTKKHWLTEMCNWWNQSAKIVLKHNKQPVSMADLGEWFLTSHNTSVQNYSKIAANILELNTRVLKPQQLQYILSKHI